MEMPLGVWMGNKHNQKLLGNLTKINMLGGKTWLIIPSRELQPDFSCLFANFVPVKTDWNFLNEKKWKMTKKKWNKMIT